MTVALDKASQQSNSVGNEQICLKRQENSLPRQKVNLEPSDIFIHPYQYQTILNQQLVSLFNFIDNTLGTAIIVSVHHHAHN